MRYNNCTRKYNYLLRREVQDFLLWGEEGTGWNYLEDGISRVQSDVRRNMMKDDARKRDETGSIKSYMPSQFTVPGRKRAVYTRLRPGTVN